MYHTGECGCSHQGYHGYGGGGHHQGCCGGGFGHRRFFTREETVAQLEEYLNCLKVEVKGLEEYIAELKK
jgi:hypothetical protein